jgi:hypothetical protein
LVNLTQFFPFVLPSVLGCPDPTLLQAIRSACVDFCTTTLMVQELVPLSVATGSQDYEVDVPSQMQLVKVLGVFLEDTWLEPVSVESVRKGVALRGDVGSAQASHSTPTAYFQKTPTTPEISLYPLPIVDITEGLTVRAAFAPTRSATSVDNTLYDHWVEAIAAGALSRLMALPGQPYTNPAEAAAMRAQFSAATRSASILARTGRIAASSRVSPKRFA